MAEPTFEIERFVLGPIDTNCYLVSSQTSQCIVIDPSSGCGDVLDRISSSELSLQAVVLTHGHFDHIMGITEIRERYPEVPVFVHPDERPLLERPEFNGSTLIGAQFTFTQKTEDLTEGNHSFGDMQCTVLHIPGHSPGGCAVVLGESCFSGDALFAGSIGRTDFPGGDHDTLISSIKRKLLTLPDETVIFPGHGNRTTVAREKRRNPFIR